MEIPNNLFEIKYEIKLPNYKNKYMSNVPNKTMHYVESGLCTLTWGEWPSGLRRWN